MKTLVVYYSRKGYAEEEALKKIREENADFLEIETVENTAGWYGFLNCTKFAVSKKDMLLFPYDTDVASYDRVIICAPVWFGDVCPPMAQFMKTEKHNIRKAEYIFVHALPVNVRAIADKTLRLTRDKLTSVQCISGHVIKEEEF